MRGTWRGRRAAALTLAALAAALPAARAAGVWGLTEVYEEDLRQYYSKFTGNLTGELPGEGELPTFLPGTSLGFEQAGATADTTWPYVLKGGTSAGAAVPGPEGAHSGVGYATSVPSAATSSAAPYSDALRACGPAQDASPERDAGCTPDLGPDSPYGAETDPGFGPAQWAFSGGSMGPPNAPTGDELGLCAYSLTVEADEERQLECRLAPARGGYPWPQPYGDAVAVARFSASGAALPRGVAAARLPPVFQRAYATVPLRWGFEEGTLAPFWELLSAGLPTLAVTRRCLLSPHSGDYQLCSAYPWPRRNATHGLLHVRSVPFVLGAGDLTWEMNGGDASTPQLPRGTLDMAINGEGALGVALSRASDGYRVLSQPARSERFWATQRWTADTLAPFVGQKFTLDVFDYRCCDWGWLAVDTFVIPAGWVQITSTSPSGGPIAGGTTLTIVGQNFGDSPDGLTVFVDEGECANLQMPGRNTLRCITPPCTTCNNRTAPGRTVSVVVGDRTRTLERGPFGGHQAGHCGAESLTFPFSRCAVVDPTLPAAFGTPLRGWTYRASAYWAPATLAVTAVTAVQDKEFSYYPRAVHPDGVPLVYTSGPLPGWLVFEPGEPVLTGTPLVTDAVCPYGADCSSGVPYTAQITASDGLVSISLTVTVYVTGPGGSATAAVGAEDDAALPPVPDFSYDWASEGEWDALRARARNAGYAQRLAAALEARGAPGGPDDPNALAGLTEDEVLEAAVAHGGRGAVQMALVTLMARAAEGDTAVDAALTEAMAARAGAGAAAATGTAAAKLRLALRARQSDAEAAALLAMALGGGLYSGAFSAGPVAGVAGTLSGAFRGRFRGAGTGTCTGNYSAFPLSANTSDDTTALADYDDYSDAAPVPAAWSAGVNGTFFGECVGTFTGVFTGELSGDFVGDDAGVYGGWIFSMRRAADALPGSTADDGSGFATSEPDSSAPAVQPVALQSYEATPSKQPYLFASAPASEGDDFDSGAAPPPLQVPPGGQLMSVQLPTPCASGPAAALDPLLPSCAAGGFSPAYTLWVALPAGSLKLSDAAVVPADFPHADLLAAGLASADVAGLAAAVGSRAVAYARRRQDVAALPARYNASWAATASLLTLTLAQAGPPPAPSIVATLDIAHAYPAPPPGEPAAALWAGVTTLRVLRLDGVPFHADEAAAAITAQLAKQLPPGASLSTRVTALEAAAQRAAGRCANDCSRRGTCDAASAFPPVCRCARGATGADCSAATCPGDCSGRGACDAVRLCTRDAETGTTACSGGSGRCACDAPWTGNACAQRACGSAYATLEGLNVSTLSAAALAARYNARGWAVDRVWVAPWDGLPRARGAVPGDEYYRAGPTSGVAVVRFVSALDAEEARAEEEAAHPRVPARGVAASAPQFMTQYRAAVERERFLLRLFNQPTADCSGRGACDVATGVCACDAATGAVGTACELRTCPSGCSGHGACDAGTGECVCDAHYAPHPVLGCALAPLGLASTVCEDAALDDRVSGGGVRLAPLQLSCLLGVPLGLATGAGYCQPGAVGSACFTAVDAGSTLCADCSGYAPANVSQLQTYPDESCARRPAGAATAQPPYCVRDRRPSDILPGVGALPPSGVTFRLDALRAAGVRFSAFSARPGIVRRWAGEVDAGGCGDCGGANPYCGANFSVLLDGVVAWQGVVASGTALSLDVRAAHTLTLRTATARAPHWRFGGAAYSGTGAPGVASQPVVARWCDGAAWADAKLL